LTPLHFQTQELHITVLGNTEIVRAQKSASTSENRIRNLAIVNTMGDYNY